MKAIKLNGTSTRLCSVRAWNRHLRTCLARSGPEGSQTQVTTATPSTEVAQPSISATPVSETKPNNTGVAIGAVAAAVVAFSASNLFVTGPTLASLQSLSVPLDVALSNGKPTVLEFYADWCEVCRELVPYEYEIEQQYGSKVNFVMLNVDNSKWAQEASEYGVGGIPHFVFLDEDGTALAAAVGRLPKQVLEGNISALAQGQQLPYAAVKERTSPMTPPEGTPAPKQSAPRDHA